MVEVRSRILKENDLLARTLRESFQRDGVTVISFVSSPGAGKTTFLEKLMLAMSPDYRIAALVGDLATENDAARLLGACSQVRQITTGTICHLDAKMIANALQGWKLGELDFLFIENVGNLVCPSSYDLGEQARFVLLSSTEGEDKPLKYPTIFNTADVALMDLAAAAEFDSASAQKNIQNVRPGMRVIKVSSKTGLGLNEVIEMVRDYQRRLSVKAS
jgi:hydrogenase nickel incorporation protein HypB